MHKDANLLLNEHDDECFADHALNLVFVGDYQLKKEESYYEEACATQEHGREYELIRLRAVVWR